MAATTLSQPVPKLEVTDVDDDMEISSDIGRADHDIDIDIDVGGDQEFDYMLEDTFSEAATPKPASATSPSRDDIMIDESNARLERGGTADIEITDEPLLETAEEYDSANAIATEPHTQDVDIQEAPAEHHEDDVPGHGVGHDAVHDDLIFDDNLEEDHVPGATKDADADRDHTDATGVIESKSTPASGESAPLPEQAQGDDKPGEHSHAEQDAAPKPDGFGYAASATSGGSQHTSHAEPATEPSAEEPTLAAVPAENNHTATEDETSGERKPTETILTRDLDDTLKASLAHHPVIVIYDQSEISLFPPTEGESSETYFLHDEALLNACVRDLLRECRHVLGNTIGDDEELEIEIEELGLRLHEDSIHCDNVTLAEMLSVYLQLHRHDGTASPYPLYMTLSSSVRFSSRLASLKEAAAQGTGLSELVDQSPEAEPDDEYDAEDGEQDERAATERHERTDAQDSRQDDVSPGAHDETARSDVQSSAEDIDRPLGEADKDNLEAEEEEYHDDGYNEELGAVAERVEAVEEETRTETAGNEDAPTEDHAGDSLANPSEDTSVHGEGNTGPPSETARLQGAQERSEEADGKMAETAEDEIDYFEDEECEDGSSRSLTIQGDTQEQDRDLSRDEPAEETSDEEEEEPVEYPDDGAAQGYDDLLDEEVEAPEEDDDFEDRPVDHQVDTESKDTSQNLGEDAQGIVQDEVHHEGGADEHDPTGVEDFEFAADETEADAHDDSQGYEDGQAWNNVFDDGEESEAVELAQAAEAGQEFAVPEESTEDEFDFVDDIDGEGLERPVEEVAAEQDPKHGRDSPLGKRSWSEHNAGAAGQVDGQDIKRVRSS